MATLPRDSTQVPTSAAYMDPTTPAPTATEWAHWQVSADGGIVTIGKKADAAVTNPASSGTLMAFTKGIASLISTLTTTLSGLLGKAATGLMKAEDEAHVSGDYGVAVLTVRQDTPGTGLGANGDYGNFYVDSVGRLRVITKDEVSDASNDSTAALVTTQVAKASAGKLWGFQGYVDSAGGASALYVQVHDKATAAASTNVPKLSFPVIPGQAFSLELGRKGRAFGTGISFALSTTGATYTAPAGNYLWYDAQYE